MPNFYNGKTQRVATRHLSLTSSDKSSLYRVIYIELSGQQVDQEHKIAGSKYLISTALYEGAKNKIVQVVRIYIL